MDITGIGSVAELVNTAIGKIWPDKTEADKQQLAAAVMVVQGQIDINKAEAASPSVFVSGWRPFIGWVCGAACAWNWVGISAANTAAVFLGSELHMAPADVSEMLPLLFALLGLGTLRTAEKIKGVAAV